MIFTRKPTPTISPVNTPPAIQIDTAFLSEDFSQEDLQHLSLTYHAGTNSLKEIVGIFTTQKITNEKEALYVLLSVRTLFGISSYDFYCSEIEDQIDSTVYTLNQLYNDVPVEGGFFQIGVDSEGNTTFIRGNYVNNIHTDSVPQITHEAGIKNMNFKSNEFIQEIQLIIYGLGKTDPCLCWKYVISSSNPLHERIVYLHADSGNVIDIIQTNIN